MRIYFLSIFLFLNMGALLMGQHSEDVSNSHLDPLTYGQGTSKGVSFLGMGIVGVPLRISKGKNQLEFLVSYYPGIIITSTDDDLDIEYHHGISLLAGYNYLLGAKKSKSWLKKHFVSIKGGLGLNNITTGRVAVAWHREAYKPKDEKYSRSFDLGLFYETALADDVWRDIIGDIINNQIGIYFSVDFSWYR